MDILTLDELKQYLGINDTTQDTALKIYLSGISETLISMIGRNIMKEDYIERYEGTNSTELILRHYPINNISNVQFVLDGVVQEELTNIDYVINKNAGILYRDSGWLRRGDSTWMSGKVNFPRKHIRVEYNAGYEEAPGDLKLIALQLAKEQYNIDNSEGNAKGLKSYSISDVKMEWKQNKDIEMSDRQLAVINKYRGVKF